jgi:hypothetical protein
MEPGLAPEAGCFRLGDRFFDVRQPLYQLKITLLHLGPPVWRRVVVKRSLTLRQLHRVIQAAMGWENYHLYEFQAGGERLGEPDPEVPDGTQPAAAIRLSWLLRRPGDRTLYVYDFGDNWRHEVLLEDLPAAEQYRTHPVCIDGARSCPPEDIGSVYGYGKWLALLRSRDEADARDARVILGRRFDPERFDIKAANRRLKAISSRRR